MTQFTTDQEQLLTQIDRADRLELARLWRFAPPGHPIFSDPVVYERFQARFELLGGWSPELSKLVGWER